MYFIIYKLTNTFNGKVYIGKHQTTNPNDGYMGSGKLIRHALKKYGRQLFTKEVLFFCSSLEEMNSKELELVTEDFCRETTNYNLRCGGKGGFTGIVDKNGTTASQLGVKARLAKSSEWRSRVAKKAASTAWTIHKDRLVARSKRNYEQNKERMIQPGNKHACKKVVDSNGNVFNSVGEYAVSQGITIGAATKRIAKGKLVRRI